MRIARPALYTEADLPTTDYVVSSLMLFRQAYRRRHGREGKSVPKATCRSQSTSSDGRSRRVFRYALYVCNHLNLRERRSVGDSIATQQVPS